MMTDHSETGVGTGPETSKPTPEERRRILARIHSLFYWVGVLVPEEELIEDTRIPLRDIVYNFISKENPTEEEIQGALALAKVLEKKAHELEEKIKEGDITKAEARKLFEETAGLLRAVDDLRHAKGDVLEVRTKALMAKIDDEKRWLEFVKKTQ